MGSGRPKVLVTLALHALTHELAIPPFGFGFFPRPAFRRFFEIASKFHLAKNAFPLHFFL